MPVMHGQLHVKDAIGQSEHDYGAYLMHTLARNNNAFMVEISVQNFNSVYP